MKIVSSLLFALVASVTVRAQPPAPGQTRVDSRHLYERTMSIVPMTGTGSFDDPVRPMYTPPALGSQNSSGFARPHRHSWFYLIEAEFKKYKKDFDFTHFGVRMP